MRRIMRAAGFLRPHRSVVGGTLALTLAAAALGALEPLLLRTIFDGVAKESSVGSLVMHLGILAVVVASREALAGLGNWLTWRVRLAVQFDLLQAAVDRLYRLPQHVQRTEGVGAIMTRLDRGIQGFVGAVAELAFNVLPGTLYLVLAVGFMVHLDWRLTLVTLLFLPIPGWIAARAAPSQIVRERTVLGGWSRIYARFNEVLSGIVTVRSFAMEDAEKQRFLRDVGDTSRVVARGVGFDTLVGAMQNLVVAAARIAAIGFGAVLVLRGETSVGTIIAFLGYVAGLFGPVQGLVGIYKTLRTASVSMEQIFSILDAEEYVKDAPGAREAERFRGGVRFDRVSFEHEAGGRRVLDEIDLDVLPGETVALVGASGAGKSTLMSLLQRFHNPTAGAVLVDGVDLRSFTQASVRKQIGVVLQEPLLFNDTVRNNIAYGNPSASPAEIEAAAVAANADGFIRQLPLGYDTPIGERGGLLSTGERQRVAIARALLKHPSPSILILDEATSALDAESESLVQEALGRLTRNRTTFVIAHRLSTVTRADRIVVMHQGRIVESGTHAELMRRGTRYAALVRQQILGLQVHEGAVVEHAPSRVA